MRKLNLQSHLINTLPNIMGLEVIRQKLETAYFTKQNKSQSRTIELSQDLPIHKITQIIPEIETLNLQEINENIKANKLNGYIMPTYLLEESLLRHPLPLSAQKQSIIENICKMNNGPTNEAEGISIIYGKHEEMTPLFHQHTNKWLSPNLPSQIISILHKHNSSRLTIGEAKSIYSIPEPYPYGEAILQLSHLRYHVLDLDLSIEITEGNIGKNKPIKSTVGLFESCSSFPFKLNNQSYSNHGFILYLKGDNITPAKIKEIIGLTNSGFGGVIIASGIMTASVLSGRKKGLIKNKHIAFKHKFIRKDKEAIGVYNCDPNVDIVANGYCDLEKTGQLINLDGELILAFFPYKQTFIAEYK